MGLLHNTLAVVVAAGSLMVAKAAHAELGVAFVHGTSDQSVASA